MLYFPLHLKHITTLSYETSAMDAVDFQQVTEGVYGCDQVQQNSEKVNTRYKTTAHKYSSRVGFNVWLDILQRDDIPSQSLTGAKTGLSNKSFD